MTQEEKVKAYDRAVAMARDFSFKGYIDEVCLYDMFPELAESEDEKIRKDLLYWLYSYKDGNETFVPAGDVDVWISYLEKQGEQNGKVEPIEGEFPYNNPADTLEGEINNIWKNVSCDNRFSATKEGFEEVIRHFVNFVRQKPAWSKEDETMITDLSVIVHTYFSEISGIPFKYDLSEDKIRTWLKALKDRVLPQPKQEWSDEEVEIIDWLIASFDCLKIPTDTFYQSKVRPFLISLRNKIQPIINEWSEEDEKNLQGIIDEIQANKSSAPSYDINVYDRYLSWLKSLRPQNTWKPSEEQMKALNTCIMQGEIFYVGQGTELQSLYNDLKKFTE